MIRRGFTLSIGLMLAGVALSPLPVAAKNPGATKAAATEPAAPAPGDDDPDPRSGIRPASIAHLPFLAFTLPHREMLARSGIYYRLNHVSDLLANVAGGMRRGTTYSGRTELIVDARTPWEGGAIRLHGFHIHGAALSRSYVGNLAPVSNIEAFPAVRLYEAWIEQKFGALSVRGGQLAADTETAGSSSAGLFLNGTFGWPVIHAANVPDGGPAYPLATPGVMAKLDLQPLTGQALSWVFAVYNGAPARPGIEDPQRRNRNGLDFRLRGGALYMTEGRYDVPGDYAGAYRIGGWYHSARFDDQRFGTDGLSLANPASNGQPISQRGNYGLYAVIDQTVVKADEATGFGGLNLFGRAFVSPSDRNGVSFQLDGGFVARGPFGRKNDAFGVAASYIRISDRLRGFDRDFATFNPGTPVRSHEIVIEANYLYEVVRGWTLQPNLQYIVNPGARILNPRDPLATRPMKNATVIGVRSSVRF